MNRYRLKQASIALRAGGVIAYPTEAVWGLGCDPQNAEAVVKLCELKRRPLSKGLILLAADAKDFSPFVAESKWLDFEGFDRERPTTWLVPHGGKAPDYLTGGSELIALRVSKHKLSADLCRVFGGAIVSTSANPAGQIEAQSILDLKRYFPRRLNGIVPGPLGGYDTPSQIIDANTGTVLRS